MMTDLRPLLSALFLAVIGCGDESIRVTNAVPQVTALDTCYEDDRPMIRLSIADLESDPVDLALRVGDESSAAWLFPGSRGVGLVGLATRPNGQNHTIHWGPCPEMPTSCLLPIAVTDLEPEFISTCECAQPPSDGPFPSQALTLVVQDQSGYAEIELNSDLFSGAPCE